MGPGVYFNVLEIIFQTKKHVVFFIFILSHIYTNPFIYFFGLRGLWMGYDEWVFFPLH